jgi:hypothetical protein
MLASLSIDPLNLIKDIRTWHNFGRVLSFACKAIQSSFTTCFIKGGFYGRDENGELRPDAAEMLK